MSDQNETDGAEEHSDVDAALEKSGFVESDEPGDDSDQEANGRAAGLVDKLGAISGTGKDLDAYNNDPIAGVFTPDGEQPPRGAKHIARGIDGLSPIAAAHPIIDIGVGFVLLAADDRLGDAPISGGKTSTDAPDDDGDDSHYRGDMT